MTLHDHLYPEAVLCQLEAADKEDALRQLVRALVLAKAVPKAKAAKVEDEVLERERQASTGIGRGVGIPHARSAHLRKIVIAIGRVPGGIDFGAVDGERVRVILLLISPEEGDAEHLAAMKQVVSIVRDPYQCKRLLGCTTTDSFLALFRELDGTRK